MIVRLMRMGLAVASMAVFLCNAGFAQSEIPGEQSPLGDHIDFGSVPIGNTGTATYTFEITETSETAATVTIYPPSPPFGLQGAPSGPFSLAPGQPITFGVTFTPTATGDYTGSFTITAQGGYPVQEETTTVYLTGHGGSGGEAPPTPGITIPFIPLAGEVPARGISVTTDEAGKFKALLSPTATVTGRLTNCEDGSPLANLTFQLEKTNEGFSISAPGFLGVTTPIATQIRIMGLSSIDLGIICLEEGARCDCSRLPVGKGCERFPIQYYIEIPEGCRPITMSLLDSTSGAALWDKAIWTEEMFNALSAQQQRDVLANQSIVGVESGRVYEYRGPGLANSTKITIARREGHPNKWIFEISSCCHTIPTLEIGLHCPGKKLSKLRLGLSFDEHNQYKVFGQVPVGNALKKLTLANYNSFFDDCAASYCDVNSRRDPNSLGSNGRILLQMAPDPSCKFDLDAFVTELYARLKASGCRCEITNMDNRYGALRGTIYTNRCTPQVVACIRDVLSHYPDCKEIYWIGRQINIRGKK